MADDVFVHGLLIRNWILDNSILWLFFQGAPLPPEITCLCEFFWIAFLTDELCFLCCFFGLTRIISQHFCRSRNQLSWRLSSWKHWNTVNRSQRFRAIYLGDGSHSVSRVPDDWTNAFFIYNARGPGFMWLPWKRFVTISRVNTKSSLKHGRGLY